MIILLTDSRLSPMVPRGTLLIPTALSLASLLCGGLHADSPDTARSTETQPDRRKEKLDELAKLSAPLLFQEFEKTQADGIDASSSMVMTRDLILTEMVRRGGKECEDFLSNQLNARLVALPDREVRKRPGPYI